MSQLENKGQLKRSVDSMKTMVALIISSLNEPLKSDFANKKVLITEVSFCAKIFESIERILFKKGRIIWENREKK